MNQSNNFTGQHIFSQILSLTSRESLSEVFRGTKANHYYKQLKGWEHFVSMMFCVLGNCQTLREITMGLEVYEGKLNHLGIEKAPARSTLSDANKNRPSDVFKAIYQHLQAQYTLVLSDSTLPKYVLQKLFLIDSTVFSLFKEILRTSGRGSLDGKRKGGIKKNAVLNAVSLMPELIRFTAAAVNDQQFLQYIQLPRGSYLTFDKGYNNYAQFAAFTEQGIFFITRQKENAVYTSLQEHAPKSNTPNAVLKDETIQQTYKDADGRDQTLCLRRIAWWNEEQKRVYEFITNNFDLPAKTVADIYRYRWQIELFFKKLKQNFPLQYFVGDNQNAIEIQIWCALIAMLLLQTIHSKNKCSLAFSNLVSIVRLHLYNYTSLAKIIAFYNKKKLRNSKTKPELNLFSSA